MSRPNRSRRGWPRGWRPGVWPSTRTRPRIVHLDDGVDFLGFNVRRYRGKLLIKPSKAAVKRIRARLTAEMRALRGHNAQMVLIRLNPIIRGWSAYYRHAVSAEVFNGVGLPRVEAHLQVGEVHASAQGKTLDRLAVLRRVQLRPGATGGCSVTATAAPTCSSSPGRRSPGTRWSRGWVPRPATPPRPATGQPGGERGTPRSTRPRPGGSLPQTPPRRRPLADSSLRRADLRTRHPDWRWEQRTHSRPRAAIFATGRSPPHAAEPRRLPCQLIRTTADAASRAAPAVVAPFHAA